MASAPPASPSLAAAATVWAPPPAAAPAADLSALLRAAAPSCLEPLAFFVSWQGVLTLAYEGFPPALIDLKRRIGAAHTALPSESRGSLWPKTSVGCLRDGVTLSEAQFTALNALCKELSARVLGGGADGAGGDSPRPRIVVDSATVAIYACRSQERLVFSHTVAFEGGNDAGGTGAAAPEERRRVEAIVAEADAADYYPKVARGGNRETHYCGPAVGSTLVHQLPMVRGSLAQPGGGSHAGVRRRGLAEVRDRQRLLGAIDEFRRGVEAALPGAYRWFDDASLHVTLRALIM